jgi:hypothetical protein
MDPPLLLYPLVAGLFVALEFALGDDVYSQAKFQ